MHGIIVCTFHGFYLGWMGCVRSQYCPRRLLSQQVSHKTGNKVILQYRDIATFVGVFTHHKNSRRKQRAIWPPKIQAPVAITTTARTDTP